jgi:hypothetical protein
VAKNYRPVALTNHITKAFEKIVKNQIVFHLAQHDYFNYTQHGFRSGRSTLTNLIEYYESILHLLAYHQAVDSIYLDYSKAFDKCDHNIILTKLHTLGIGGKVSQWIDGFLKRRQQQVVVRGCHSAPVWCTSGVPQGSVLGPLLFIILMYDITKNIFHSMLTSFADDTKVWKGVSDTMDEVQLQDDLDMIYQWAERNNMQFNSDKFQAIRFAELCSKCHYNNNDQAEIHQESLLKDLGIYMSEDMSFDHHARLMTNKGKQMAGWILRTFRTRSPLIMLTLLKQLIYPTIEYNSILWSPARQEVINLLESVQYNFLKKINSPLPSGHDYWDCLQHFKLYSLQRRRERYAIIYAWKVVHNLYPNPGLQLNSTTEDHTVHPNQGIGIALGRNGLTARHNADLPKWLEGKCVLSKCCDLYNCLPPKLRRPLKADEDPKLDAFKTALDKWLSTIPDQPMTPGRFRPARTNSILDQLAYQQPEIGSAQAARRTHRSSLANRPNVPFKSRWDD